MKNKMRFFGIIAFVAIMGFVFVSCDTNGGNEGEPLFSVSGTFAKSAEAGGGEVKFELSASGNNARSARSSANENTVSGVLEDGDFTIRLSGSFDPETLTYSASAAASIIRYTINGAVDEDGNSLGSTATLLVRENLTSDNWQAFSFVVTEAAVVISGTPQESQAGGVPAFAHGIWNFSEPITVTNATVDQEPVAEVIGTMIIKVMANQWDYALEQTNIYLDGTTSHHSNRAALLEVTGSGTTYDLVLSFPQYEATREQEAAAIKAYLTAHGIAATQIQSWDDLDTVTGGWFLFFEDGGTSWGGFTEAQWRIVDQYWRTNALLQYLISNNIPPVTKFEKARIVFSDNNTVMTWMSYIKVEGDNVFFSFNTLEEARALTVYSEDHAAVLTR